MALSLSLSLSLFSCVLLGDATCIKKESGGRGGTPPPLIQDTRVSAASSRLVWSSVVQCGLVWFSKTSDPRYESVRCLVSSSVVQCGSVWSSVVWCCLVKFSKTSNPRHKSVHCFSISSLQCCQILREELQSTCSVKHSSLGSCTSHTGWLI